MFRLEMLPAAHGDCLWIEYGTADEVHRILVDGGPTSAYPPLRERILHLPPGERRFDLLVITHVDGDHIEGVIRLLQDAGALGCTFDRIWFNGRDQLNAVPDPAGEPLGALQGEIIGVLIADYEERTDTRVWNPEFGRGPVTVDRSTGELPDPVDLPGGCRLTILSPDQERLLDLKDNWAKELRRARLTSGDIDQLRERLAADRRLRPMGDVLGGDGSEEERLGDERVVDELLDEPADVLGSDGDEPTGLAPFGSDHSEANGASIGFLLEYPADHPRVRVLLTGDAWASVLEASLAVLEPDGGRLAVDAVKLAHHGSVANITEGLLSRLRATHYLISTSGAIFSHPHERAIDLLLDSHPGPARPRLHFNHLVPTTQRWSDPADQAGRGYLAYHPRGISLDL